VDIANLIQTVAIYALPVLFAITVHEAAHGYAARHFGDNTAYMMGRITLNPIKHIDPIGTIAMPLLLYFATSGAFLFGYAKPVPVNFGNLRNPKRDMIWVALAGPASNFVQAIGWAILFTVLVAMGLQERFFLDMAKAGVLVNLVMWAFNLFPAAAAGWRAHPGGPAALEAGPGAVPRGALGLFHRDGPGDRRHRRHLLAAPPDGPWL
jgi:Zn-dependent protease